MQDYHAELIDLDEACEIMEQSSIIETIRAGELSHLFLCQPERGYLTFMQGGLLSYRSEEDMRIGASGLLGLMTISSRSPLDRTVVVRQTTLTR